MELEELKQKWTALNEGLSRSEVYNKKVLTELVKGRTQTTYDKLRKGAYFNLIVTFGIAAVLIPLLRAKGIYGHESTFWILEAVCVLGLLMVICRQGILSRLNVTSDPATQLHNVMIYKRFCVYGARIGAPLAVLAIAATLFIENTSSPVGYVALVLGVIGAAGASWFGWQKHKSTVQEIEQNMADLKEFAE